MNNLDVLITTDIDTPYSNSIYIGSLDKFSNSEGNIFTFTSASLLFVLECCNLSRGNPVVFDSIEQIDCVFDCQVVTKYRCITNHLSEEYIYDCLLTINKNKNFLDSIIPQEIKVLLENIDLACYNVTSFDSLMSVSVESILFPIITVVEGHGKYAYKLNDGPIQDTNYFITNVSTGEHTITVYDISTSDVNADASYDDPLIIFGLQVIDYLSIFTPNGDYYNDYWNIIGFHAVHKAEIHIFDRYGKLLKQLHPQGEGWDGTYNGVLLPSTDYWFKVMYTENDIRKEFKAHFSLKR